MKMKEVTFLRGTLTESNRYNEGETASFPEETANRLIEHGDAELVREYEKEVDPLSEMGLGDYIGTGKKIEARQERQDTANKITIKGYKWVVLCAIAAVITIALFIFFKVVTL